MKGKKEIKEMAFIELELYYFLHKAFNELKKFIDLIKGKNKTKKAQDLYGEYYTFSHAERKVIDSIVKRANNAKHYTDVDAAITIITDSLRNKDE
jgi:hypothetical protein